MEDINRRIYINGIEIYIYMIHRRKEGLMMKTVGTRVEDLN